MIGAVGGTIGAIGGTLTGTGGGGGFNVSDDFNRTDSATLGADWSDPNDAWNLTSNQAQNALGQRPAWWATAMPSADHYTQVVVPSSQAAGPGVYVRGDGGAVLAEDCYFGYLHAGNTPYIFKRSSGTDTQLAGPGSTVTSFPCTLRLEAEGDALRLYVDDVLAVSTTDSTYPSQTSVGMGSRDSVAYVVDDFAAGTLA